MKKVIAISSILAFVLSASSASAFWGGHSRSSDITITTSNSATVSNTVYTSASTGGNSANGGSATNSGKGSATGGNGGVIGTGEAVAGTSVENYVNSNETDVTKNCNCKGDLSISTTNNSTYVTNSVETKAKTGYNSANGGSATNSGTTHGGWHRHGSGGGSANAGHGGFISTGNAASATAIINVLNSNVTRVH